MSSFEQAKWEKYNPDKEATSVMLVDWGPTFRKASFDKKLLKFWLDEFPQKAGELAA